MWLRDAVMVRYSPAVTSPDSSKGAMRRATSFAVAGLMVIFASSFISDPPSCAEIKIARTRMEIKTQLIYIQWFIKPNAHLTYYEVVGLKEDMGGGGG